jgi:hypothetical protein
MERPIIFGARLIMKGKFWNLLYPGAETEKPR